MPNSIVPAAAPGLPVSRADLERMIEEAIDILDFLDGDPDLEPWLAGSQTSQALDAEEDDDGWIDEDLEPSLGSLNAYATEDHGVSWSSGATDDREAAAEACRPFRRAERALTRETEATLRTAVRLGGVIARLAGNPTVSETRS